MMVHVVQVPLLPHQAPREQSLLLPLKRHVVYVLQGQAHHQGKRRNS